MPYYPPQPVSRGTFAARPSAGSPGQVYVCNDGPLAFVDDGTTWQPFIANGNLTPVPLASSFTLIQAGGRATSLTDSKGGLLFSLTNPNASDDYRLAKVAKPVASSYAFTVHMTPMLTSAVNSAAGICFRNSSTGNATFFGICTATAGSSFVIVRNETASAASASPTFTFSSDVISAIVCNELMWGQGVWLRLTDDGTTNKTWSYSLDGQNFVLLASVGRTSFMTPDEIGLFVANIANTATSNAVAFFDSYVAA